MGQNVKFRFRDNQKAHPCVKRRLLGIDRENRHNGLRVTICQNPKTSRVNRGRSKFVNRIVIKFCIAVGIRDPCKFWWPSVHTFLGSGGRISHFPIDFGRLFNNTVAQPCQRVISYMHRSGIMNDNLPSVHTQMSCLVAQTNATQASCQALYSICGLRVFIGLGHNEQ